MTFDLLFPNAPIPLSAIINRNLTPGEPPQTIGISKENWHQQFGEYQNFSEQSGLYVFWWKKNEQVALPSNTSHWVKGKEKGKNALPKSKIAPANYFKSKKVNSTENTAKTYLHYLGSWDFESKTIEGQKYYPLYVGKSTNVLNRIIQHLRWSKNYSDRYDELLRKHRKENQYLIPRYNTASQFSDHYHFLFRNFANRGQAEKARYVYLSVSFTPFLSYADRFFHEDWLIGTLRPPFNLDSER